MTSGQVLERLRPPVARPLLGSDLRRLAAALMAVCVAVTGLLGVWFAGQPRPGRLDTAVDLRVRAALGGHPGMLNAAAGLGDPLPVTVMIVALVLACLATRRPRGAALAAVAVPAAAALTEFLLKPLVGRTLQGAFSFPSGHSTGVFALAGTCAVLLAGPCRPPVRGRTRLLLALGAYLVACVVAAALIGLGIHYFTDTVGGAAVATAVVLVIALILDRPGPPERLRAAALQRRERRGQGNVPCAD
jgi:membrane-associated phospholipid phosphatase